MPAVSKSLLHSACRSAAADVVRGSAGDSRDDQSVGSVVAKDGGQEESEHRDTVVDHGQRVTAALARIFGDMSDTYNDCCCSFAYSVRQAPTSDTQKTATAEAQLDFVFSIFGRETTPLEKRVFDIQNLYLLPEGPRSSIDSNSNCSVAVKSVLTLQLTRHPFSYPAGFKEPCTLPQCCHFN